MIQKTICYIYQIQQYSWIKFYLRRKKTLQEEITEISFDFDEKSTECSSVASIFRM